MIGTIIAGRYELLQKIGEGGMSVVYKAKCNKLNRYDAIKILKSEFLQDKEIVEKFKREATAIASFYYPNIVNVYDVGTEGDINYIVMEYVDGKTLKEIITENGVIHYKRAIDISLQISKALECSHNNGVIHRDIKPQNIMIKSDGMVKVTDFGIAKMDSNVTMTNTSKVFGSAQYISPEQAQGKVVDLRTDIYSLGCVMYEMVTGRVPHESDEPIAIAIKHINENPIEPMEIVDIPKSLNDVILKAMSKNVRFRYQSMSELIQDLNRVKQNENVDIGRRDEEASTRVIGATKTVQREMVREEIEDDYQSQDNKTKRKLLIGLGIIAVVVVSLIAIIVTYNMQARKTEIKMPLIINKSQTQAKQLLDATGIKYNFVVVQEEYSEEVSRGKIIKSTPKEGTILKDGDEIGVWISKGIEEVTIPEITNELTLESAKALIESAGLKVGEITYNYDDKIPDNYVISISPFSGKKVNKGTEVNIVVSRGKDIKSVKMPNLINMNYIDAKATVESSKLKFKDYILKDTNDKNKNGIVFDQSASSGAEVLEGTEITISYYVYKPDDIVVPAYANKTFGDIRLAFGALSPNITFTSSGILDSDIVIELTYDGIILTQGSKIPPDANLHVKIKPASSNSGNNTNTNTNTNTPSNND